MANNPQILFYKSNDTKSLQELLDQSWAFEEFTSLKGVKEAFDQNPESLLITKVSGCRGLGKWLHKYDRVPVFLIYEESDILQSDNIVDYLKLPMTSDELKLRLTRGYQRYVEYLRMVDYSNKVKRESSIQSQMNDRLLKVSVELKQAKEEIEQLSLTDSLTGVRNRRFFDFQLERDILQSARYKTKLSMFILDIDNFKHVNDTFGHQVGDEILIRLSKIIMSSLRDTDWAARYGGEEFCVVLPMTDMKGAIRSADRIRKRIEKELSHLESEVFTASIGVANFDPLSMDQAKFVYYADESLYHSKKNGKNKVSYFSLTKKEYCESSSGKSQPSYR